MDATATLLPENETDDFYTAIRVLGYNENEFEVHSMRWPCTAKPAWAVHDLIVVKRTLTEVEISYPAVSNTASLLTFVDDLCTNAFGPPKLA